MTSQGPDPGMRPRRHPDTSFKSIGDEGGLVVLPSTAEVQVLNPTGIKIYSLLDGEHTPRQIAEAVALEFEVTEEEALNDVQVFLDDLARHGMLASSEPASGGPSR